MWPCSVDGIRVFRCKDKVLTKRIEILNLTLRKCMTVNTGRQEEKASSYNFKQTRINHGGYSPRIELYRNEFRGNAFGKRFKKSEGRADRRKA